MRKARGQASTYMSKIKEFHGNIFESSCQTLVNTVNCVGVMGKGIALEFKSRFPEMFEEYARYCATRRMRPGVLHLWKKSTPWILNFPTKNHWKYPAKVEYIEEGLTKFASSYTKKGITSIAFPELGTSSGALSWSQVKDVMYSKLQRLQGIDIEIYHFDPSAHDSLFDKLYQRIHRFSLNDYKEYLGFRTKQAGLIHEAVASNSVHSMLEIQDIEGVGEKTIEALYKFANAETGRHRLVTQSERQPTLPF